MKITTILSFRRFLVLCLLFITGNMAWAQTPVITGPDTVCVGVPSVFTATPVVGGAYTWLATPATPPASTTNTATITFTAPTTTGNVTVLFPGFTPPPGYAAKTVVVIPAPDLAITSNFEVGCQSLAVDTSRKGEQSGNNQNMLPDGPCIKVCENSIVRYYATGATGTFTWNVVGATVMNDWGDSIEVQWGAPGTSGTIALHAVTPCADYDKVLCIQVTSKPKASFSVLPDLTHPAKTISACVRSEILFHDLSVGSAQSPLVSWFWIFGDGTTSAQQNPSHSYDNPGNYTISLVVKNACNCTDTFTARVKVSPEQGPDIVCPSVVCEKQKVIYKTSVACGNYVWHVTGGSISNGGGPTDPFVEVVWSGVDFGYVSLATPGCSGVCPGTTTIKVPVVRLHATIDGPTTVCTGKEYEYSLPLWPGTSWNWGVINNPSAVLGLRNDYKVVVKFTSPGTYVIHGTYQNTISLCGGDATLTVTVKDPSQIIGNDKPCEGQSETYSLNTGDFADWTLEGPAPQSASATSFTPTFSLPGTYVLTATGSFCSDPLTIIVQKLPAAVNTMTGDDTVCLNVPYTYKATVDDPNSVFTWSAVGGTVTPGNGNEVTVVWTAGGSMQLNVWRENIEDPHCAGPVTTMNITQDPFNPTIAGANTACGNGYNTYTSTYTSGDTYLWNVSPVNAGSVTGNVYGQSATVLWKNVSVPTTATISLIVTKCGKSDTTLYSVTVNPSPAPVITGPATACPGYVTFTTTPGAASYTWDIPGVFTGISGNTITVQFPYNSGSTSVPYTVKVTATGTALGAGCPPVGIASTVINILPGPVAYASTPGPLTLCPGQTAPLIGTYTNNVPPPTDFYWYNGTLSGPFTTPNSSTSTGGTFVMIAVASNGCRDTSNSITINTVSSCGGGGGGGGGTCTTPPTPATISAVVNCNQVTLTISNTPGTVKTWSYSGAPTSGANTTTPVFDIPGIYTITYRETWPFPYCYSEVAVQVQIGLKPDFYPIVTCGPGNTYNVNFEDRTAYLSGWTINSVGWSIAPAGSASPATGTGNSFTSNMAAGTSYMVTETVFYTDPNSATGSCTIMLPFSTPTKPDVLVELPNGTNTSCEGLPMKFHPNVVPGTTVVSSYLWDFGGGGTNGTSTVENPETGFANQTLPSTPYIVTVSITDAYGCTASGDTAITIFPNALKGRISGGDTVCSGTPVTLTYNSLSGTPVPPYLWHWDINSAATSVPTYNATQSGAYWLQLFDVHQCRFNTPGENVMIIQSPVATIRGDVDYCDGDAIKLNGFIGAGTIYEWKRNGSVISTAANITDAGLTPATYTYQLTVTNTDPISGVSCSDVTSTSVTINPLPVPPTVTGPVIIDCATNEMTLTAAHGSPGTFTWSNGTDGAVNTINQGGPYRVWYTNSLGCRSHKDVYVPQAPEKYFEYFPSGCYSMCKNQLADLTLFGPPGISFQQWNWLRDGNIDATGFNSTVAPYHVPSFGKYQERLDNGMCVDTSAIMDISDANCINCDQSIRELSLKCNPSIPGRYDLHMVIVNANGLPASFTLGSDYGPVLPSIGSIGAGSSLSLNIQFNSTAIPPPAQILIQLTYMYPDGRKCYTSVKVKIPNCTWDPQRPAAPAADNISDGGNMQMFTLLTEMELYPNPATQQATVAYDYGTDKNSQRYLVVYDVAGRKVAQHKVEDRQGKWIMNTGAWISGTYLIRMEEDGTELHTQRLVVTH